MSMISDVFLSWIDLKEQCLALQTSVCNGPSEPSPFTKKSSSIEAVPVCRTSDSISSSHSQRGQSPRSQYTWNKLVSSHTPLKLVTFIYFYQNDRKMMLNHDKLWSTIIGFGKPTLQRNPHGTMDRRKSTGPLVRCKGAGHCARLTPGDSNFHFASFVTSRSLLRSKTCTFHVFYIDQALNIMIYVCVYIRYNTYVYIYIYIVHIYIYPYDMYIYIVIYVICTWSFAVSIGD